MHVNGKKMAFAGMALALTVILIALSGILEFNTLFLLAAAAFFVGIVIDENDFRMGAAFYAAAVLLGFILAPNKFYCITFAAMGLYILAVEGMWEKARRQPEAWNKQKMWIGKYIIFNLLYLPLLFGFPQLLFGRSIQGAVFWLFLAAGQAALFIYDRAYEYFMGSVWRPFRKRLRGMHR